MKVNMLGFFLQLLVRDVHLSTRFITSHFVILSKVAEK